MKKIDALSGLLAILVLIVFSSIVLGESTVTTSITKEGTHVYSVSYTWTADASGNVTSTDGPSIDGHLMFAVTNPGSTAPTDNYDITLTESADASMDVMGGELANRSTSSSQQAMPKIGNSYGERYVKGPLTLNISNNASPNATGTIKLYIRTDAPAMVR